VNVTVWRCDLDNGFASLDTLDEVERARAAAFVFEHHRRRYIVAHSFLRSVLGAALTVAPTSVRFSATEHGKPYIANHNGLTFNLSHSDHIAYVAIGSTGEIGIDVELHRHMDDVLRLAEAVFSPDEIQEIESVSADTQIARFLHCWTRKESYVKAVGVGLGAELTSITVRSTTDPISVLPRPGISDSTFYIRTLTSSSAEYVALATSVLPDRVVVSDFNCAR
jgi:4'-phosphopantetheinyl transferase